jgi:hypothetical protein
VHFICVPVLVVASSDNKLTLGGNSQVGHKDFRGCFVENKGLDFTPAMAYDMLNLWLWKRR